MNILEYYKELEALDWTYYFSEDQKKWRAGQAKYEQLNDIAMAGSLEFRDLFIKYKRYTEDPKNCTKPPRP